MLSRADFFDFEDKRYDFPFYKSNTDDTRLNTKIMVLGILVFIFLIYGPIKLFDGQEQVLLFLVMLITFLFFSKANVGTFFRLPEKKDIRLIIICYILYQTGYIAILAFFNLIHYQTTQGRITDLSSLVLLANILQIIAEEIFRALLFLLLLKFTYNRGFSRKKAITISIFISLIVFGLMHFNSYPNILQILLIQGFGGFAEMYPYIKTKNLTLSVIVHLCINIASWFVLLS